MAALAILSRWIHVVTACVAVGGVFFIRFVFPTGLKVLPEELRMPVLLKTRRTFKMVVHSAILLLLITGIYNSTLAMSTYNRNPSLMQSLWGMHMMLALIAFCIALYVLAGAQPPKAHRTWMAVNFVVLLCAIAMASTLKWAREKALAHPNPQPAQVLVNP